ncbi:hypothetical protein [Pedobacter sp. NJ-S-72]
MESKYYSIDTLKMLTSGYEKFKSASNSVYDLFGFDKEELQKRIISKNTRKDSTEIIFKGLEVNPKYDNDICIFLENNTLISPINDLPIKKTTAAKCYRSIPATLQIK